MTNIFAEIPGPVLKRMQSLEEQDARDRGDGTPPLKRLRQIPPETGMLLALLAMASPAGDWLELGASAGYSALWLSLAARARDTRLTTYELLYDKADLARETFREAEVESWVELVNGDARGHMDEHKTIAFCFLDAEKEMYLEFYDLVVPRLAPGGILVADNVISHAQELRPFVEGARHDGRVDAAVLPVGKGLLVCTRRDE